MAAYANAEAKVSFDKPETVAALIDAAAYDSKVVPKLELYVEHQAKNNKYDAEANRHLLKLYQFTPARAKADVIAKILLKALMALPATDFQACSYLVSEKQAEAEPVKTVFGLATQLQSCQFSAFWKAFDAAKAVAAPVAGFEEAIRSFVLATISITYQVISSATLKEYLHISDAKAFEERLSKIGWKKAAPDAADGKTEYVTVPATEDNAIALQKEVATGAAAQQTERIRFDQITKVLAAFS